MSVRIDLFESRTQSRADLKLIWVPVTYGTSSWYNWNLSLSPLTNLLRDLGFPFYLSSIFITLAHKIIHMDTNIT